MSKLPPAFDEAETADPTLITHVITSIQARMEHVLQRPLIARIVGAEPSSIQPEAPRPTYDIGDVLRQLDSASAGLARTPGASRRDAWRENEDGTWTLSVDIDYDDRWRGYERDVRQNVEGAIDDKVALLTLAQRELLERSPREFLALYPPPEKVDLLGFDVERIGGTERITALTLADRPERADALLHIAIVPNLVPLERQLAAAQQVCSSSTGPVPVPLLALLGLAPTSAMPSSPRLAQVAPTAHEQLDPHQRGCVQAALATPHFAAIQGPPGSGKTTFLAAILRREIARGSKVLVVSPTNVAVDNVVEKLIPDAGDARDALPLVSTPLRYAPKHTKVAQEAVGYWVGPRSERRSGTIALRLEQTLRDASPFADALYRAHDPAKSGLAPLSSAIAQQASVLCGTPIGLLSYEPVKQAGCGAFDLLLIDEVSKLTLPEFLAIAVKARRWVLVGDPQQLPPYVDAEQSGATLQSLLPAPIEAACSVAALIDALPVAKRSGLRVVVVAEDPGLTDAVIAAHLWAVDLAGQCSVLVCAADALDDTVERLAPSRHQHRAVSPEHQGSVRVLLERGVTVRRPDAGSGVRLVEDRERAAAMIFDVGNRVLHASPWSRRAGVRLRSLGKKNMLPKLLPSAPALRALRPEITPRQAELIEGDLEQLISERFAINSLSIYDWLVGLPDTAFEVAPLDGLGAVLDRQQALRDAVRPYLGTLRNQYRMAPSLSQVPRELFYFGEALHDGLRGDPAPRVRLIPIKPDPDARFRRTASSRGRGNAESNPTEADAILSLLSQLSPRGDEAPRDRFMIITPYRAQEREINAALEEAVDRGALRGLAIEVCTLDRCQGREAEHVFISLVRGRATAFLDAPKRWNVALTRAKESLWIVGDTDSYLSEARTARQRARQQSRGPTMSLLARILEAYERADIPEPWS